MAAKWGIFEEPVFPRLWLHTVSDDDQEEVIFKSGATGGPNLQGL